MDLTVAHGVAGAGKTALLLGYLDTELKAGVPKDRIAYVSFTNEGAYVGRTRAMARFGGKADDYPFFRTLHSLAFRALGLGHLAIMQPSMYKYFGDMMGLKLWGHSSPDGTHTKDDAYVAFDHLRRNNPKEAAKAAWEMDLDKYQWFDRNYKKFKAHEQVYDFTDLLEAVVKQRVALPVDVAIIDEAQDLTTLQWKVIWTMFGHCERMYVAGDADQAIYQWSGADVPYYLTLKPTKDLTVLSHTYRCPALVARYASKVLDLIKHKIPKTITSRPEPGVCELVNELSDLNINPDEPWLFLARNNVFLDPVEEFLQSKGLTYQRAGKESVSAHDMALIKKYGELQRGKGTRVPGSDLDLAIKKGKGLDAPWFEALDLEPDTIDYYRAVLDTSDGDVVTRKKSNIRLSTVHSAKGAEATNVVFIPDLTTRSWRTWTRDQDSELRCYYVAVTRAQYRLFIMAPKGKKHLPLLF